MYNHVYTLCTCNRLSESENNMSGRLHFKTKIHK